MGEPTTIGQVVSGLQTESTKRSVRTFDLSLEPMLIRPDIAHSRDQVDPRLWNRISDVACGRSAWPLLMIGGVGVGKTCAALCLLDACRGPRRYTTTAEAVRLITAHRSGQPSDETEGQFWAHWRKSHLVVLDEIGSRQRVTDAHYEIVKQAIDYRLGRPAVFISNLNVHEISEVYDDRIASRLLAGTVVRMFDWCDRRAS